MTLPRSTIKYPDNMHKQDRQLAGGEPR